MCLSEVWALWVNTDPRCSVHAADKHDQREDLCVHLVLADHPDHVDGAGHHLSPGPRPQSEHPEPDDQAEAATQGW